MDHLARMLHSVEFRSSMLAATELVALGSEAQGPKPSPVPLEQGALYLLTIVGHSNRASGQDFLDTLEIRTRMVKR